MHAFVYVYVFYLCLRAYVCHVCVAGTPACVCTYVLCIFTACVSVCVKYVRMYVCYIRCYSLVDIFAST